MEHMIITIGCEYGAGGPEIGRRIADELGIEYYNRDLVDKVVEQLGVDRNLVVRADEGDSNVRYSFETQYGPRYANLSERVVYMQCEVIRKFADNGSCVIIGRCANYILRDRSDALNLFIYAPEDIRVKSVMDHQGIEENEAREKIRYNDEQLHIRYKYLTGTYRGDRHERHMMIDSSLLGWEGTSEYLLQLIDLRFGGIH
ncbi:MAG: cytidylate kinase-like family protein [Lachnospiraceae bacterium]|jgi:cytidylate kinase|nr:cytidylate kinase-like family protein [Lachnospiraceae bacterium]MCI1726192.1 cytidylate kinase-like family protein [Lachnospiraceae bacterium]